MTQFLNDTFTDADGTALTAHTGESGGTWIAKGSWTTALTLAAEIVGNKAVLSSDSPEATFISNEVPGSADYSVSAPFRIVNSIPDWVGIGCRMPATDDRIGGYVLLYSTGKLGIWQFSNGTPVVQLIQLDVTLPVDTDLVMVVGAVGTSITGKIQRVSDGFWLNSAGTFQSSDTNAVAVTNSVFTAAGRVVIHLRGSSTTGFQPYGITATDSAVAGATSVTITGPASGTVGSASTNFTATLDVAHGSDVIVTPSDGGAGGTFTPATRTITAGSTSGTFTYTAASPGVKTISVTNNAGLSNIGSVSYTASATAATAVTMTGPSSGLVGTSSTNFTVGANGTITGTIIVTPSDSGGGGTFTPTTVSISSGTPTATFTYTAGTAGAKTVSVTNNGGLTNPGNITYTASTGPVTVPVTNTNLYFSPYNWYSDGAGAMQSNNAHAASTFAWTNARGAYLKFKAAVGASGSIKLNVDTSSLQTILASACPRITWSIEHGAYQEQLLAYSASPSQIVLASGLAAGTYDVFLAFKSVYILNEGDDWTTPLNKVHVTGVELSAGGSLSTPNIKPNTIILFGDSITEGDLSTGQARSATSQNTVITYGFALAEALNSEIGIIGKYATNWGFFAGSWSYYANGKSRLISGALSPSPTWVISMYGENDNSPFQSTIDSTLAALAAAAPSSVIVLGVPFSGRARSYYYAAALPANCILVDTALPEMASGALVWCSDGQHPNPEGHAKIGAALAGKILAKSAARPVATKTVTISLVNASNVSQSGLSGLKYAFFDEITPDKANHPVDWGTVETTDGSGVLVISVHTNLSSGQTGWLIVTNSDGNPATVHKAFSGPVVVS